MLKTKRPRVTRKQIERELEQRYEPITRTVLVRFGLRDEDDARDAVHAVALRLLSKGALRVGNWGKFLSKAAVNQHRHDQKNGRTVLFTELSKDEQQRIAEETPGPLKSPATLAAEDHWKALIQTEVAKLAPRQRAVVTLWSQNFTHKQIASELGLKSPAISRSTLRDGLAALEKLLRARGISECTFCRRMDSRE